MKIVHISNRDSFGGAARAAVRLHRGLREESVSSYMFVRDKYSEKQEVVEWSGGASFLGSLRDRMKRRWLRYRLSRYKDTRPNHSGIFTQAKTVSGNRIPRALPDADLYHLHLVGGFIDPLPFFHEVQQPVVWTLHDMNPFTGGCHQAMGCRQFEDACGKCPQLGSTYCNDLSRSVWRRKKKAYQHALGTGRLHFVAVSNWLAEETRKSALLSAAPLDIIPPGLDHKTFKPRDTEGIRGALGIPQHHRVVLFVAQSAQNYNKGFDLLAEAIDSLGMNDVTLLSIGGGEPDIESALPHIHLGTIRSNLLLSLFYNLADLFIIPSRREAFGLTALESMACGTPVVGHDTGGIPDMVRPGETGWLAELENPSSLRDKINQALSDDAARQRRGARCRDVVEEEYTLGVQARAYKELYEQLLYQYEEWE